MKIALLAPPYLSVPPHKYGGTEMIVSLLCEGLVAAGYDVTLFATGDSHTTAKLSYIYPQALGNDGTKKTNPVEPLLHYFECFAHADQYDLIHNHAQYLPLFLSDFSKTPVVHTWHGPLWDGETKAANRQAILRFKHQNFISISRNQAQGNPALNFIGTVYNGIDIRDYDFHHQAGDHPYLLWVGRITQKKGPLDAIKASQTAGMSLYLAAAVDPIDRKYYETEILPLIDGERVKLLGEMDRKSLAQVYAEAQAVLYPIHWHEPFGLVMTEAMACGTPVIAYGMGSVPEVVRDGVTGYVITPPEPDKSEINTENLTIRTKGIEGLVEAIGNVRQIDRATCRQHVLDHFTSDIMVSEYIKLYRKVLGA